MILKYISLYYLPQLKILYFKYLLKMEKILLKDKYPVWKIEIEKSKLNKTLDEIVDYFVEKIEKDPIAKLIGVFDHWQHTKLIWWDILEWIKWAKMVIFCFWKSIPSPLNLAVKPKSIGIAELNDKFVISFLEAPSEGANEKMRNWVNGLLIS